MDHQLPEADGDKEWRIALYYCYIPISNVEEHVAFQKEQCILRQLQGRIRVSHEGINGVLSGTLSYLQDYEDVLRRELSRIMMIQEETKQQNEENEDTSIISSNDHDVLLLLELDVKYCHLRKDLAIHQQLFDSLSVKVTREVVSLYESPQETPTSNNGVPCSSSKRYFRRRKRNRHRHEAKQQQQVGFLSSQESLSACVKSDNIMVNNNNNNAPKDETFQPAPHLSPQQWNEMLLSLRGGEENDNNNNVILLDARNVYESRVGYFAVKGVPTLLTNTRKYSSLPSVLETAAPDLAGKHVFMYCTGGVRCERASVCLQQLVHDSEKYKGHEKPKGIYQLHGGIQRYLEQYGSSSVSDATNHSHSSGQQQQQQDSTCLYKGKNFVFDPRRTDPVVGRSDGPGLCLLCDCPHNDYDNGHAPCENREARCCNCRVLVLVCNDCRTRVRSWGEPEQEEKSEQGGDPKPNLYCGGNECINEGNSVEQALIVHG